MICRTMVALACLVVLGGQYRAPVPVIPPPAMDAAKLARVDRLFVEAASESNLVELQAARLALARSDTAEVRSFASKMIAEHSTLGTEAARLFPRNGTATTPSAAEAIALAYLQEVPKPDFDQQYMIGQIGGHLAATTVFAAEARDGANAELRAFAAKWLPTIQSHLQLAVDLTKHIGGSSPFKTH